MSNGSPPSDLTAFEGPDDWVSLYLDGIGEDMFTDAEVCMFIRCLLLLSTPVYGLTVSGTAAI